MDAPTPVLPDYDGACLTNLAASLRRPPAARPAWLPDPARHAARVVLLVLDGLGWEQLESRPDLAPTMSGLAGGRATSVAPTTTAAALSSITSGVPPARHGIVGYRLRGPDGKVLNVLRWRTVDGDARRIVDPASFMTAPAFGGSPDVPMVTRADFAGTGFTTAHAGSSRLVGWRQPSTLVVETARLIAAGEPFVYAYYDGVDSVAHAYGLGEHWAAEVRAADRLVADLLAALPPSTALVVTADHGQVDVGPAVRPVPPPLASACELMSGEGRFRWLHLKPGASDDARAIAHELVGHEAWVFTRERLIDEGWLGGRPTAEIAARLGDLALVAHAPVAFLDPADPHESRLMSRHGSLTSAEMYVPLLAGAGQSGKDGTL